MSGDHGRDRFYTIKLQNNLLSRATNISKFARHIWIGGLNDKAHSAAIDGNSPDKITADKVATIRQLQARQRGQDIRTFNRHCSPPQVLSLLCLPYATDASPAKR